MVSVELLFYKITKLKMVNDLQDNGTIQVENKMDFDVKYEKGTETAVATLVEHVKHRENPLLFCIELQVEGIFQLAGIKDVSEKKEAHIMCYDELFPYAKQIMTYLAVNSGIQGLMLKKIPVRPENVKPKSKASSNCANSGKIIEFRTDI